MRTSLAYVGALCLVGGAFLLVWIVRSRARPGGPKGPAYTSVTIALFGDARGQVKKGPTVIRDAKRIDQLKTFFPQLGSGKRSRIAGAWKSLAVCDFEAEGGTKVQVHTNYRQWSVGDGDWPVNGDLSAYLDQLTK
jgi:hypothetical protein